ncbi:MULTISPECIES: cupin domain-containing protein [Amycolatopsis]|uniref:cupin domain-containing protein n=1 Tax=Amycolatopsis TaxID=1813 RepID=UPI000399A977|nr:MULTISPECIES: cupin domain-containing protein [Amycolatopsis]
MHVEPEKTPTMVLDWGTLKWLVNPSTIEGAETTVGEVIVYPGRGHAIHNHPNAQEVIYVIEGEGVQTVGDSDPFPIKTGDAVFVPRGADHSTFNTGWRALRLIVTYSPGGEERNFRSLPDYEEVPAGITPTWVREARPAE